MIRIHREGRLIVVIMLLILLSCTVLTALYLPYWASYMVVAILMAFFILIIRFFRVPYRRPFLDPSSVTSPADGRVVVVERVHLNEYIEGPCIQISVFMSIHDVHINYYPSEGTVEYVQYHPGRYLVARHPKSSSLNEHTSIGIRTPLGTILVRQVAGAVARRIRCYARENTVASQGDEMGFIKFGSRLDVFLPVNADVKVTPGQKVLGSITPLARFKQDFYN